MMTENSLPFQDGVGDGGPYSADDWDMLLETVGRATGANIGVVLGILNELAISSTGNNNIRVATGRGQVEGTVYENTANLDIVTASPADDGTGRRCVLRKDWSTRTVRAVVISSASGVGASPALTQVDGVTWEIPLASFTISSAGVISALTDEREYAQATVPFGSFLSRAGQTRWSRPGWIVTATDAPGGALLADVIYFTPILIQETRLFDRIGIDCETLAAGEVVRLGIYDATLDDDGWKPNNLVVDGGTVSVAATGDKEVTISETLNPGLYFLAHVQESATPRFRQVDTSAQGWVAPVTGLGGSPGGTADLIIFITAADAGADYPNNGLPDPAIAVTNIVDAGFSTPTLRDTT